MKVKKKLYEVTLLLSVIDIEDNDNEYRYESCSWLYVAK